MLWFKKKSLKQRYDEAKLANDLQDKIIGRFNSVSDNQLNKLYQLRYEMERAKRDYENSGAGIKVVPLKVSE